MKKIWLENNIKLEFFIDDENIKDILRLVIEENRVISYLRVIRIKGKEVEGYSIVFIYINVMK